MSVLARVQFDLGASTPPATVLRPGTRRQAYGPEFGEALALLVTSYADGRTLVAAIDDDGRWTCAREPRLAALLNRHFGPDFEPTTYYSPDPVPVEVARDAAYALGGRVLGAERVREEDVEDVVF